MQYWLHKNYLGKPVLCYPRGFRVGYGIRYCIVTYLNYYTYDHKKATYLLLTFRVVTSRSAAGYCIKTLSAIILSCILFTLPVFNDDLVTLLADELFLGSICSDSIRANRPN